MQELMMGIHKGMAVEDADGDAVGSVSQVYPPVNAQVATPPADPTPVGYLKVNAGLFGLAGHWYIPSSAIRTVVDERVILTVDRSKLEDLGYDEKPAWIES
jgi:hypothetical protein